MIKSPLRYPGGKSKLAKKIYELAPLNFKEYREPFLGGGSVFLFFRQKREDVRYWINDLNEDLYLFWVILRDNVDELADRIYNYYDVFKDGRDFFNYLRDDSKFKTDLDRAARYYSLNRIVYSGLTEIGGYSDSSYKKKFSPKFFEKLYDVSKLLKGVKITNLDYSELLKDYNSDEVFFFFDPPYYCVSQAKLYGKNGELHYNFDHNVFFMNIKDLKARFLITYDYSDKIINMYKDFYINEIETTYFMSSKRTRKKEAFITNYKVFLI